MSGLHEWLIAAEASEEADLAKFMEETKGYDEWIEKTSTIREWLNGGAVNTDALADQLQYWAEWANQDNDSQDDKSDE